MTRSFRVVSRVRDGGIPPKLATCLPKFGMGGGRSPTFDKMFYSIGIGCPLFSGLRYWGGIWNLDTTLSFDVWFDLWFEMPSQSLWDHCNGICSHEETVGQVKNSSLTPHIFCKKRGSNVKSFKPNFHSKDQGRSKIIDITSDRNNTDQFLYIHGSFYWRVGLTTIQ